MWVPQSINSKKQEQKTQKRYKNIHLHTHTPIYKQLCHK